MRSHNCLAVLLAAMLLVSCSGQGAGTTPDPEPESTATFTPTADIATSTPSPTEDLVLWLVPRFAPRADTTSGALLLARLQAFEANNPGLTISTRIKQEDGSGSLLGTLQAATVASPATLPDIVTLDEQMLDQAGLDDLIMPLDDLLAIPSIPGWYDFSIAASLVNGGQYGLPFAADGEVLAYSIAAYPAAPRSWEDLLDGPAQFMIPTGDPQAAFTLNQYLMLGGSITNNTGVPTLEAETLTEAFSFYEALHTAGVLPQTSMQYSNATETWTQYSSGNAVAALAPLSSFFAQYYPSQTSATPLPASTTAGSIFIETWSWAIVPHDPAREALAAELLEWLSDPEFLGPWTDALDLLPPSAPALAAWPDGSKASIASRLVTNAQAKPADEILDILGPPLQDAIAQILLNLATAEQSAAAVIADLQSP